MNSSCTAIDKRIADFLDQYPSYDGEGLDNDLIQEMTKVFPNDQLALIKAYTILHNRNDDKAAQAFINDFEFKLGRVENEDYYLQQYNSDESTIQSENARHKFNLSQVEFYEKEIQFESKQPETLIIKLFHPKSNKSHRIKELQKKLKLANKALMPLSAEYESARDRQVEWLTEYGVKDKDELVRRLHEYREYAEKYTFLYEHLTTMVGKRDFNVSRLCKIAQDTAWYGQGPYEKGGTHIVVFDTNNPEKRVDIHGETYEIGYEDYSARSTVMTAGQLISQEKAEEIVKGFENPCAYTENAYKQCIDINHTPIVTHEPENNIERTPFNDILMQKHNNLIMEPQQKSKTKAFDNTVDYE